MSLPLSVQESFGDAPFKLLDTLEKVRVPCMCMLVS